MTKNLFINIEENQSFYQKCIENVNTEVDLFTNS